MCDLRYAKFEMNFRFHWNCVDISPLLQLQLKVNQSYMSLEHISTLFLKETTKSYGKWELEYEYVMYPICSIHMQYIWIWNVKTKWQNLPCVMQITAKTKQNLERLLWTLRPWRELNFTYITRLQRRNMLAPAFYQGKKYWYTSLWRLSVCAYQKWFSLWTHRQTDGQINYFIWKSHTLQWK